MLFRTFEIPVMNNSKIFKNTFEYLLAIIYKI